MFSYNLSRMPNDSRFRALYAPLALSALALSPSMAVASKPTISAASVPDSCKVQVNKPGTIQQAIDSGCAAVLLGPGTYSEKLVIAAPASVTIEATSASGNTVIDGGGSGTVIRVRAGAQATLKGLTIQNGNAYAGGILNVGTLNLVNTRVINNTSVQGGGIYNYYGTLTLTDSTIQGNTATYGGGGIFSEFGTVTLNNSLITGNVATGSGGVGGGIFNNQGTVTLSFTSVTSNQAGFQGGGIFNNYGSLSLTDSIVQGNSAGFNGGGIFTYSDGNPVSLVRTTVSGNTPD